MIDHPQHIIKNLMPVSFKDTCHIQYHCLPHGSRQTEDEKKLKSSESSNHLIFVEREDRSSMSCCSDMGPVREDLETYPYIVKNMSDNVDILTKDHSVDKPLETVLD